MKKNLFIAFAATMLFGNAVQAQTTTIRTRVPSNSADSIQLMAGPGMLFYRDYGAGFQFGTTIAARVSDKGRLFIGADLGVGFLGDVAAPFSNSVNNTGATLLQILPTVYYVSEVGSFANLKTYLGLSVGPNIFIQNVPVAAQASTSETKVYFQMMLRPGVSLDASRQVSFQFEPRIGVLRSAFLFNPQLNVIVGFI